MSIILLFLMLYFIAYIIGTVQTPILHASLPRALLRRLARQMPASAFPPETEAGQGFDFSLRVSDSRFFSRVLSFKILPGCFRLALTMTFQGSGVRRVLLASGVWGCGTFEGPSLWRSHEDEDL